MQLQSRKSLKGYTLIEILVGLSIIAILFSVGYLNFRDFARRQAVVAASRALRSDIRLAQEQALAGQKPAGCGTLDAFQVNITSASTYEVDAVCGGSILVVKQVTAQSGITFTAPTPNPIRFKVLANGTNIASGGKAIIGLTQGITNNYRSVVIGYSGDIKESTETPAPTATASPTPTPSAPPSSWHYIGRLTYGCGTTVQMAPVPASQISFTMAYGGGGDGIISYNCFGSTGMQANFGGTWVTAPGPCQWGATSTTVAIAAQSTVSQIRSYIGCNDGETAAVDISYYGP